MRWELQRSYLAISELETKDGKTSWKQNINPTRQKIRLFTFCYNSKSSSEEKLTTRQTEKWKEGI